MYRFIHLQPKILSKERIRDRWSSIVRTSFFPSFVPSPFIISSFLSTLLPLSRTRYIPFSFQNLHTFVHFYYNSFRILRFEDRQRRKFRSPMTKKWFDIFSFFKVICDDIDRIFRYRVISPSNRIINFQIIVKNLFFFFLIVLNTLDILSLAK